jgi:hypothetical protein
MKAPKALTAGNRAQLHKDVFNNAQGRQLLGDMVTQYVFNTIEGATEWERGIFEGKRRLVLEMAAHIAIRPDQLPEFMAGSGDIFGDQENDRSQS